MSQNTNIIKFLIQSIVLGLAVGFLIVYFFPTIINKNNINNPTRVALDGPVSYSSAVKKIAPSVVSIYAQSTKVSDPRINLQLQQNPALRTLLPQSMTQQYLGSGVVMSADGYIVTSYHVIDKAHQIIVSLWDNTVLEAKLIGYDTVTDLAVLKIEAIELTPASFTDSDKTETGDVVMTVGNPFGLSQSVSLGIISAKGRSGINVSTIENFIQTDASINQGNSGGALINATGDVVGISSSTFNQNGAQGINFAIPSNVTQRVMQEIVENGKVFRGWLGILLFRPHEIPRISKPEQGVVVQNIYRGSPAQESYFNRWDNITHIGDIAIQNNYHYHEIIAKSKPGEILEVSGAHSNGKKFNKQIKTVERPPQIR
ncbi:MAG: S1C family serine protease [Marinicellaceae bacterium]